MKNQYDIQVATFLQQIDSNKFNFFPTNIFLRLPFYLSLQSNQYLIVSSGDTLRRRKKSHLNISGLESLEVIIYASMLNKKMSRFR